VNGDDESVAVEVVRRAGEFVDALLVDFPKALTPGSDAACERELVAFLLHARPHDSIHGEEGSRHHGVSGRTWVIDPIDGSDNVRLGLHVFGSACGVFHDNGDAIAGAMFSRATVSVQSYNNGDGAKNSNRSAAKTPVRVGSVLQGRGLRGVRADAVLSLRRQLEATGIRVLKTHAPTLDWTLLIQGRIDFVVFCETSAEDTRVGIAAAEACGLRVSVLAGRRWPPDSAMAGVAVAEGCEYVLEHLVDFDW
jgi:myo-inositol-1(or 4)-monophosphatase